ncbi:MAG: hypothetical protein PVJ53_06980, partial [Desulfobacterales bacterium]
MTKSLRRLTGLMVVGLVGLPFVPLFLWSFSERWFFPDLWPQAWGMRAWTYITSTTAAQVLAAIGHSALVGILTALVAIVIAVPAGRALGLFDFRGKDLISVLLTLPIIVPPLCVAMGLHLWFIRLELA